MMAFQSDVFQANQFVTTGAAGPDPLPGITGDEPSLMEAIAGYARAGATRAGDYGAYTNRLLVNISGVNQRAKVWQGTISVEDNANEIADTGSFQTHTSYRPVEGEEIIIAVGTPYGGRKFGGRIQKVTDNELHQHLFDIALIDWTPDLDSAKVFGSWRSTAADVIFREIIAGWCPGFSAVNVTKGAPSIPELNATGEAPSVLFQQITDYLGWMWKADQWKDVHLKERETSFATGIKPYSYHFDNFRWWTDVSQVRTVCWGIGGGGALSADYTYPGSGLIVLPMDNVDWYRANLWVLLNQSIHNISSVNVAGKTISLQQPYLQPIPYAPAVPGFGVQPAGKIAQSTPVNIIVRRENADGIARMKALGHPTGRIEHLVSDSRKNENGVTSLCDANLVRFAHTSRAGEYDTWNEARSGQLVQIQYPDRKIWGDHQIQHVRTVFTMAPDFIERHVSFSDTMILTFLDLLRAQARKRKDR
jgi:hypothetical protein